MADYISIDEFSRGWKFFTKKMKLSLDETFILDFHHSTEDKYGRFPCSQYLCSGCDDWLDAENQNRNANKL